MSKAKTEIETQLVIAETNITIVQCNSKRHKCVSSSYSLFVFVLFLL